MKKIYGSLAMICATVLWGIAFSAQSSGVQYVGTAVFTALRSAAAVPALIITVILIDLIRYRKLTFWGAARSREAKRDLLYGGAWCGAVITLALILQQAGLKYTTVGKTGFLTALYIIFVPLFGVFFKKKTNIIMWISVLLALCGSCLLCGGISGIGAGELFVTGCALVYSIHVLVIDKYAAKCDCVRLSCIQFAIAAAASAVFSLLLGEPWEGSAVRESMPFWIFCGIGSSAMAFTLQMVAQKYLHPVAAALLMSLESVFAVLGGWMFLREKLSIMEFAGCCVIFAAVIIAQIPVPKPVNDAAGKKITV